jgi:hypothetical protein
VLNGKCRSSRILTALYNRARKNREASEMLIYSDPVEMRRQFLGECSAKSNDLGTELPPMETRRRGGQYGNQNARKGGAR